LCLHSFYLSKIQKNDKQIIAGPGEVLTYSFNT